MKRVLSGIAATTMVLGATTTSSVKTNDGFISRLSRTNYTFNPGGNRQVFARVAGRGRHK